MASAPVTPEKRSKSWLPGRFLSSSSKKHRNKSTAHAAGDSRGAGGQLAGKVRKPRVPDFSNALPDLGGKIHLPGLIGGSSEARPLGFDRPDDKVDRVRVHLPFGDATSLTPADLMDAVAAPTPEHLWHTVERGWPGEFPNAEKMMPTTEEEPCLMPEESDVIGELRVEVLETSGFRSFDRLSENDTYAVVVFEGFCGRTETVVNTANPRFHAHMPRAFRFPVTKPFSDCSVAFFDAELAMVKQAAAAIVDPDAPVGRVTLALRNMHPDTVYDAWFPLQNETFKYHASRFGSVRLRYSVRYRSSRLVMLSYLKPSGRFTLPLRGWRYVENCRFAVHGTKPVTEFNWNVLKAHLAEVSAYVAGLTALGGAAQDVLFWKDPVLSTVLACAWQFLCNHPRYIFASGPLSLVLFLNYTYKSSRDAPPIQNAPTFDAYQRAVLLPGKLGELPPLDCEPLYHASLAFESYDSEDEDNKEVKVPGQQPPPKPKGPAAAPAPGAEDGGDSDSDEEGWGLNNVGQHIADGAVGAATGVAGGVATVATVALNPLAPILGPVQNLLGSVLQPCRFVNSLLHWEDTALTSWLYLALMVLGVVLAVLPWHFLIMWTGRIVGVVLFGPHMWFVGRYLEKQAEKEQERQRAIAEGRLPPDEVTAAEKEKEKKEKEAAAAAAEREKKAKGAKGAEEESKAKARRQRELERKKLLENARYTFEVTSVRAMLSKFRDRPDARKSFATPIDPEDDGEAAAELPGFVKREAKDGLFGPPARIVTGAVGSVSKVAGQTAGGIARSASGVSRLASRSAGGVSKVAGGLIGRGKARSPASKKKDA